MITIPNLSSKTKKYILCIFQILVFIWRQRVYFRFVMSIVPSSIVSLILISSRFLILVSKHMYTWQKRQGWWSVVWDGKNWLFCDMLICSFVHFNCYVNIYSILSSLHWCLKYQKKILPTTQWVVVDVSVDQCTVDIVARSWATTWWSTSGTGSMCLALVQGNTKMQ